MPRYRFTIFQNFREKEHGGKREMRTIVRVTALLFGLALAAVAQQAPASKEQQASSNMTMPPAHCSGAPISYAELKNTVTQLERARQATAKYQDVRVAEADGYQALGPDVPRNGSPLRPDSGIQGI